LARTKIIAEAWDAAGAYQVGSFSNRRWAEWNGRYRDDVRRFWRGDEAMTGALATRLAGSSDLYGPSGRQPYHSINFVTAHDGFTLSDLVTYNEKHNAANGESNRDGENMNCSCNFGVEGPTRRPSVQRIRARQIRNYLATLFLSQGVPMLLAGDECRRTQQGNNNAWCQDNDVSWFDWQLVGENADLVRFCRALVAFRKRQPTVRRASFLAGMPVSPGSLADVSWFNAEGRPMTWSHGERSLQCLFGAWPMTGASSLSARHVLVMLHADWAPREFTLPAAGHPIHWRLFVNTAAESPDDVYPDADGPSPAGNKLALLGHTLVCYVAR